MDRPESALARPGFIQEIEGVRGIALTVVVMFHLFGNGRASGGVDVFLVISAFLLTGSLLRKLENRRQYRGAQPTLRALPIVRTSQDLNLGPHFAKVAARLIPTAVLVLAAVGVMTMLFTPATQLKQNFSEILASALYLENWELISSQLSYSAAGADSSPLQHFWSMSVQGQFFLFWPLIFLVIGTLSLSIGFRARPMMLWLTLTLTAGSMLFAFNLVKNDQAVAYFNSYARFWELGLGAVIAFLPPRLPIPRWLRELAIWLGLVLIIVCGFIVDGSQMFPGPLTLWPVGAIVLILIATHNMPVRSSAASMLSIEPFPFLAKISYALYLWHWPILIFYLQARNREAVGWRGAMVVLTLSIIAAWATERWVAAPYLKWNLRTPRFRRILPSLAVVSAIAIMASTTVSISLRQDRIALANAAVASPVHPGSLKLTDRKYADFDTNADLRPAPSAANADRPEPYSRSCIQNWRDSPSYDEVLICHDTVKKPRKSIVMSGGSHVLQWYPALREIADQQGWAITIVEKDGCRLTTGDPGDYLSASCHRWNRSALPIISELQPDAVFTVSTRTPGVKHDGELMFAGQVRAWRVLADRNVPVIAIRDTPRFLSSMPECLDKEADPTVCGRNRDDIFAEDAPIAADVKLPESTALLDLTHGFCDTERCPAVVGNVVAYRDDNHMTQTYARSLAPLLEKELRRNVPRLFS